MADLQPLRALRYEPSVAGPYERLIAPPYDVIDEASRAALAERSPYNVVEIDLPRADGGDPYAAAKESLDAWLSAGVLVRESEPTVWVLEQEFAVPGGAPDAPAPGGRRVRRGFFARVRVDDYGPGRIRPHERTHPGPKEDRLRLTRATGANLSPIFSLFPDRDGAAAGVLGRAAAGEPFAEATDHDGTANRLWRVDDREAIADLQGALAGAELLIADGHHRYETARVYANEVGGEGAHRYVLMFLCPLSDPGLTVLPTHRLVRGDRAAIRAALERDFELERVEPPELERPAGEGRVSFGYLDRDDPAPRLATLSDPATADRALAGRPEPYRRLDAAVLEALVLRDALGMSEDDIAHLRGLGYTKDAGEARAAVEAGDWDAAFLLRATPVEQVREVAAAGESMPPKSTYFHPKVPTGLVFNLLR